MRFAFRKAVIKFDIKADYYIGTTRKKMSKQTSWPILIRTKMLTLERPSCEHAGRSGGERTCGARTAVGGPCTCPCAGRRLALGCGGVGGGAAGSTGCANDSADVDLGGANSPDRWRGAGQAGGRRQSECQKAGRQSEALAAVGGGATRLRSEEQHRLQAVRCIVAGRCKTRNSDHQNRRCHAGGQ